VPLVTCKGQHATLVIVTNIEEFGLGKRVGCNVPDHQP
jgi:hypothetical protein